MTEERRTRLESLQAKIREACQRSGRNANDVTLVAVSKTKPWDDIEAFVKLGITIFGENYVQEALEKQKTADELGLSQIQWHLIGRLQSNKAKLIPGRFSLFHALDSLSLAQKLDKAASAAGLIQDCLLEVNVDAEATKGGLSENALEQFLEQLNGLSSLRITGLMCIPAPNPSRDPREPFARLREKLQQINHHGSYREKLTQLSMGMSADFVAAIEEGATLIRVGTVLFGERSQK